MMASVFFCITCCNVVHVSHRMYVDILYLCAFIFVNTSSLGMPLNNQPRRGHESGRKIRVLSLFIGAGKVDELQRSKGVEGSRKKTLFFLVTLKMVPFSAWNS